VLSETVIAKLGFIHALVRQPAAMRQAS